MNCRIYAFIVGLEGPIISAQTSRYASILIVYVQIPCLIGAYAYYYIGYAGVGHPI